MNLLGREALAIGPPLLAALLMRLLPRCPAYTNFTPSAPFPARCFVHPRGKWAHFSPVGRTCFATRISRRTDGQIESFALEGWADGLMNLTG